MLTGKAVKKPVEIDWFLWRQYSVDAVKEVKNWIESFGDDFHEHIEFSLGRGNMRVKTLEGSSYVVPDGYYIIRGIEGEYYPCEAEIFNKTYSV